MKISRREFSASFALATAAAATGGISLSNLAAADHHQMSAQGPKAQARKTWQGFENILMPSFSPDLSRLDPEGIRLDVRKSIDHGFFSSMCAMETLTPDESLEFLKIAIDEAGGKLHIGTSAGAEPPKDGKARAEHQRVMSESAKLGASHVLLNLAHLDSEEAMIRYGTEFARSTDTSVVLWWANHHRFNRFDKSGIPWKAFDALVELPNVVAMKFGATSPAQVFAMHERYGDKILIGTLWFDIMPMTVKFYGQQFSGATSIEMMQSPEKPYASDWFKLLREGKYEEAMPLYWNYVAPAFAEVMDFMRNRMPRGAHPWDHLKFYQFAVGGNGGRSRLDPHQPDLPPIDDNFMNGVRDHYRGIDIEPTDLPNDAFYVGRVNWEQGVRRKDLPKV